MASAQACAMETAVQAACVAQKQIRARLFFNFLFSRGLPEVCCRLLKHWSTLAAPKAGDTFSYRAFPGSGRCSVARAHRGTTHGAYAFFIEYAENGPYLRPEHDEQDTIVLAGETADHAAPAMPGNGCLCYPSIYALGQLSGVERFASAVSKILEHAEATTTVARFEAGSSNATKSRRFARSSPRAAKAHGTPEVNVSMLPKACCCFHTYR